MDTTTAAKDLLARTGDPEGIRTPDPLPTFNGGDADNRSLLTVQSAGFDPTIQSPAHRDGCNCRTVYQVNAAELQEEFLRCAHLGERRIALFRIVIDPNPPTWLVQDSDGNPAGIGWTEDEGLAAFYAAEEALLAGGEA